MTGYESEATAWRDAVIKANEHGFAGTRVRDVRVAQGSQGTWAILWITRPEPRCYDPLVLAAREYCRATAAGDYTAPGSLYQTLRAALAAIEPASPPSPARES